VAAPISGNSPPSVAAPTLGNSPPNVAALTTGNSPPSVVDPDPGQGFFLNPDPDPVFYDQKVKKEKLAIDKMPTFWTKGLFLFVYFFFIGTGALNFFFFMPSIGTSLAKRTNGCT
jgi:hypothetical protein